VAELEGGPIVLPPAAAGRGLAWTLAGHRFELLEPRLFLWKAASVLLLSFALFPILSLKDGIPATIYVGGLVALHVVVLAIYLYRVSFRSLEPDIRALAIRVAALAVVTYLLLIVSRFDPDSSRGTLALQLLGVTLFHAVLLALVMIRRVDRAA